MALEMQECKGGKKTLGSAYEGKKQSEGRGQGVKLSLQSNTELVGNVAGHQSRSDNAKMTGCHRLRVEGAMS